MRKLLVLLAGMMCGVQFSACTQDMGPLEEKVAALINQQGKTVGSVTRYHVDAGLLLRVDAADLPFGWHGIHLHAVGDCSDGAEGFKKAGGHLSVHGVRHGFHHGNTPHEGDLPNIWVHSDGRAKVEYRISVPSQHVLDGDGAALIIHENEDDYVSQPAGQSGARLACAALKRAG